MNDAFTALQELLKDCVDSQEEAVRIWHDDAAGVWHDDDAAGVWHDDDAAGVWHDDDAEHLRFTPGDAHSAESLRERVLQEHLHNFRLWHVEDEARRTDVPDSLIADCKRRVDRLNQMRNDGIEAVDACLCALLAPHLPKEARARQNTETAGMALDRLSILALKIYHMHEQTRRKDVDEKHRQSCRDKLALLRRQREDLAEALLDLVEDYALGRKKPALYFQFKMYNDPALNPALYENQRR